MTNDEKIAQVIEMLRRIEAQVHKVEAILAEITASAYKHER